MGGRVAHEFVCLLEAGEDAVAICRECGDAWNAEVAGEARCCSCGHEADLRRAVEIGNIFQLGTRYTDALGVRVTGRDGARHRLFMGSYGIGISRLLATLVEQNHDERGIALPAASVGFDAHLVVLGAANRLESLSAELYAACSAAGVEVLWDDRGGSAGEQLADADLVGAAVRVTVGRSAQRSGAVELRERRTGRVHSVDASDVPHFLTTVLSDLKRQEQIAAS
jgi:prolyl-tRNA synthetase